VEVPCNLFENNLLYPGYELEMPDIGRVTFGGTKLVTNIVYNIRIVQETA
jgi:hypothetical protein